MNKQDQPINKQTQQITDEDIGGCCIGVASGVLLPLIGGGVGYGVWGFGGLLIGIGLGAAIPIMRMAWVFTRSK